MFVFLLSTSFMASSSDAHHLLREKLVSMRVVQQAQERNAVLKKELLMAMECEKELLETSGKNVFLVSGTSRASNFKGLPADQ